MAKKDDNDGAQDQLPFEDESSEAAPEETKASEQMELG